jgi:hypothetical protein
MVKIVIKSGFLTILTMFFVEKGNVFLCAFQGAVALAQAHRFQHNPLHEQGQLAACNGHIIALRPFKCALLQLLDIHGKSIAIPLQKTNLVAPFANKDKHIAAEWVAAQFVAHQSGKGIYAKPHVARGTVEIISAGVGNGQHLLLNKCLDKPGVWQLMEFQFHARWVMNHGHGPGRDGCIFFNGNGLESFDRLISG